jgi:hypothetical protein
MFPGFECGDLDVRWHSFSCFGFFFWVILQFSFPVNICRTYIGGFCKQTIAFLLIIENDCNHLFTSKGCRLLMSGWERPLYVLLALLLDSY